VRLADGDGVIWEASVAAEPPRVEAEAQLEEDAVVVRWRVEPAGPVDLFVTAVDRPGRLAVRRGETGEGARLPIADLPGGPLRVEVRAVTGLREQIVGTEPVVLEDRPGTLHVALERTTSPEGQPVTVSANPIDAWGRGLAPSEVEWHVDGEPAGRGPVVVLDLPPGDHEVHARHPLAGVATATISVTSDDGPRDGRDPTP
jgi:hypothetical protein